MRHTVTAIIQARMTSTRLPGKVMLEVLGKPLLYYLIERLQSTASIGDIILTTTVNAQDDSVAKLGSALGIDIFRGSENNVLSRYYEAAKTFGAKHIMRITADCPLIDPDMLDKLVKFYFKNGFDFACNCNPPTLPDGLDAEIFTFQALEHAHEHAIRPSCLEHVTTYIRNHPNAFSLGSWSYPKNLSFLRWTVDEPDDFVLIKKIIEALYPLKKEFRFEDILNLLKQQPELIKINTHINRNEGFLKSLEEDQYHRISESNNKHRNAFAQ